MKVYVVCGAVMEDNWNLPHVLGVFTTREAALAVLKREWERVNHMIEEGEEIDPDKRREIDEEWAEIEFPIWIADEDCYNIVEEEVKDGSPEN